MSALLTTTMPYMKVVIDTLKEKGMRDDYIVIVGGALNEEFGKAIGADAYCRDAAVAVQTAKDLVARKHNQGASGPDWPQNGNKLAPATDRGHFSLEPLHRSRHLPSRGARQPEMTCCRAPTRFF